MLTARQNMEQVIKGGKPDRYVNQYEAIQLLFHPFMMRSPLLKPGDMNVKNIWGITNSFPFGTPGQFPVHTPDKIVIQDIEHWQDYVHAPDLHFTDEEWGIFEDMYNAIDTTKFNHYTGRVEWAKPHEMLEIAWRNAISRLYK